MSFKKKVYSQFLDNNLKVKIKIAKSRIKCKIYANPAAFTFELSVLFYCGKSE